MSEKDYNQRYQGLTTKSLKKAIAPKAIDPVVLEQRKAAGNIIGKAGKALSRKRRELIKIKTTLQDELAEIKKDIYRNSSSRFLIFFPTKVISTIFARMSGLYAALRRIRKTKQERIRQVEAEIREIEELISSEDPNVPTLMFARKFYDQGEYLLAKAVAEKILPTVMQKCKS